jgi:hypothetical protein
MVARIKGASDTLDRAMEFDFENGGLRERLFIKTDNTWELKQTGVKGDLPVNATGWHIYRITKEDSIVNWYLDENITPIATVKTASPDANNYFRWGDGNGSSTLGAYVDWVIWDETGAYAPDRGMVIPDSLVTYTESADASLSNLTSDVGTFTPDFDPNTLSYILSVPNETDTLTLTATANHPLANVEGDGEITTIPDTVTITVTAEDGFTRDYVVAIIVNGTDASLSDLTTSAGSLNPGFAPTTYAYELRVPDTTTSVILTATPNDPLAMVEGDGEITDLPKMATITVTAQVGNTQDYTVDIVFMSSDATLASLVPSAGTLDPAFSSGVADYALQLPVGTTSVVLTATANESHASVEGDGTFNSLPVTATITVTAEDGTQMVYTVEITVATVAIPNTLTDGIHIYPNPASRVVNIDMNTESAILQLYNFTGKLLQEIPVTNGHVRLNVSNLGEGIYFIKVNTSGISQVSKLIVE